MIRDITDTAAILCVCTGISIGITVLMLTLTGIIQW